MDFPISYTGKNVVPEMNFAQGLSEASYAAQQKLLGVEQMKLNRALQNEQFVLQQTTTPVIQFSSPAALKKQLDAIEGLKKKWGARMSVNHGQLSVNDKMELIQDKQNLQSLQKRYLANESEVQRGLDATGKDVRNYYDKDYTNKVIDYYNKTGELMGPVLKLNPIDTLTYFQNNPLRHGETETVDINGKRITRFKNPQLGYNYYLSTIYSDDRFLEDLVEKFGRLEPKTAQKYLIDADANKDKTIDETERKNAIIEYGWDLNQPAILHQKEVPIPGKTKGGEISINWAGKKINYNPSSLTIVEFSPSPHYKEGTTEIELGGEPEKFQIFTINNLPVNVNIRKGERTWGNDPDIIDYGQYAKGEIVGYDPEKNKFVVRLTRVDRNIPVNTIVFKSAEELGKQNLYNLKINVDDKVITIDNYRKNVYVPKTKDIW